MLIRGERLADSSLHTEATSLACSISNLRLHVGGGFKPRCVRVNTHSFVFLFVKGHPTGSESFWERVPFYFVLHEPQMYTPLLFALSHSFTPLNCLSVLLYSLLMCVHFVYYFMWQWKLIFSQCLIERVHLQCVLGLENECMCTLTVFIHEEL